MGDLQKILFEQFAEVPYLQVEAALRKKLEEQGAPDSERLAKEIIRALREGRDPQLDWREADGEPDRIIDVSLSDEEWKDLAQQADTFNEKLPEVLRGLVISSAQALCKTLKKNWPEQWEWEQNTQAGFQERLEQRWGKGFTSLRMMLTIAREIGGEVYAANRRSKSKKHVRRREVLQRLHVRGCQVVAEILCLMENGFADGAMARWRTLHEITVVAALIAEHDEDLGQRYLDHEAIEAAKAMKLYQEHQVNLGLRPFEKREAERIERRRNALKKQYGKEFDEPYGWAAHHLGFDGRQFAYLETAADKSSSRPYYKMASYNVHAGAKGIMFRLGLLDHGGFLAGASNTGFTEPGQHTAFDLARLTGHLLHERMGFDEQIQMQVLLDLRDEVPPALWKAERQLKKDDREFRLEEWRAREVRKARRAAKKTP